MSKPLVFYKPYVSVETAIPEHLADMFALWLGGVDARSLDDKEIEPSDLDDSEPTLAWLQGYAAGMSADESDRTAVNMFINTAMTHGVTFRVHTH